MDMTHFKPSANLDPVFKKLGELLNDTKLEEELRGCVKGGTRAAIPTINKALVKLDGKDWFPVLDILRFMAFKNPKDLESNGGSKYFSFMHDG